MVNRFFVIMVWGSMLAGAVPAASQMDAETFARKLEHAAELNVTAPWQESQAVLEELRPHLEIATDEQYAQFMLLISRNLALAGRMDEALDTLDALLEHDMTRRQRLLAYARGANIGHVARRFEKTYVYLDQALQMLQDADLRDTGHDVYSLAAYMYTLLEEYGRAEEYGRLAVEIAASLDNPRAACTANQRLAFVYKEQGDREAARRHYETALERCRRAGDEMIASVVEYGLADLLRSMDEYERAGQLFEHALEGLEQTGYRSGMAEARVYYARLEEARGNSDRIAPLLEPALDQLRRDKNWEYFAEAHRMLAEAAREGGAYPLAMQHFDRYMEARERHLDMARDRRMAFLEVQFDVRHTEQQLDLLREQQRVRDLEEVNRLQRQRLRLGIYILVALLVSVLAVLLIRATRDRRRFRSLSQRDSLTALSNHTRFFELAERTLELSYQKGVPFTLIVADIDHFKQVNDVHGHLAGDEVLRLVAGRLKDQFAKRGIIGRIGGEEFGIALPGLTLADVERQLGAFRESLREIRQDDIPVKITMSFGVATPRDHESLTAIRERADRGLYDAKHAGRDRVVYVDGDD